MTLIDDVSLGDWLADYYALATIVLLAVGVALARLRQPARRLSVAWSALGGLAALVILSALPSWPRAGWPSRPGPATTPRTLLSSSTANGPAGSPLPRPTRPAALPPDSRTEASSLDGGRPLEVARRHERESAEVAARNRRGAPTGVRRGDWPPFASRAFLAGGAVMLAWLGIGSWQTASLRRRARQTPDWASDVLARIVGDGNAAPRLLACERLLQPVAVGLLRPTVILPDRFLQDEPGARLEAVLEHEWAHIRNGDLWLIALSRLLMPILFAHPAYWWLRRRIRDDQEILADAQAATVDGRVQYAEVLLSWASGASERPWAAVGGSLALWERPSRLKRRIIMLLDRDFRVETSCPRRWLLGIRGGTALAVLALSFLTLRPAAVVADPPPSPASPPASPEVEAAPKAGGTAKVVDPDGKPVAGAEVYVSDTSFDLGHHPKTAILHAKTGPDGSFALPWPASKPAENRQIVVTAQGYGPAFADPSAADDAKTLRLAEDDIPIAGRVLDIQGRPVAGATVQLVGILQHPSGKLDDWLSSLKTEKFAYNKEYRNLYSWTSDDIPSFFPAPTTDREGRFTLGGVGRERIASLLISGEGIETRVEFVATRPMSTLKVPPFEFQGQTDDNTYHSATFDLVVGPDLVVVGTVRDKDTGKPLAGATVKNTALFGDRGRLIGTTTDSEGRYRLAGLPPKTKFGDGQAVLASVDEGPPYLQAVQAVGKGESPRPITKDFRLKRGVWARGRVTDKATGKPVRANLSYYIMEENPYLKDYPKYGTIRAATPYHADDQGVFKLVVMPGRGILGARIGNKEYRLGVGIDRIKGLKFDELGMVPALPHFIHPQSFNILAEISPKVGDDSVTCDLELDPGHTVKGTILGPDGERLAGARINGLMDYFRVWERDPLPTAEFEVLSLGSDDTRGLLFYHEGKKLAGSLVVRGDEEGPVTAKLELWGTITGRLVDADGFPQAEVSMTCQRFSDDDELKQGYLPFPIKTDKDGRFNAGGLAPGLEYTLMVWKGNRIVGDAAKDVTMKSGETRDLGDVKLIK